MASKQTKSDTSRNSRIPNFFKMSILDRISALHEKGLLSSEDVRQLTNSDHQLNVNVADKMIENVLGVFGLPPSLPWASEFVARSTQSSKLGCQEPSRY